MLIEKNEVFELLRCPISGAELNPTDGKLIADSSGQQEFDIVDGLPVLIDFKESVLSKIDTTKVSSVIERRKYTGVLGVAKRLVTSPQKTTAKNVSHLLSLLQKLSSNPRVLIVGGGSIGQGMEPLHADPQIDLVSFDLYATPHIQFIADAHRIPLPSESFDAVIVQAVLEHVLEPDQVVSEIHRVLKTNGLIYSETPFLQHVHEGPYDFTRYTESGHRYLFREFELISSGASAGAGTQLLWSIDNFFRGLFRSRRLGKVIKVLFFWLVYCDRLIPDSYNVDSASGVFFFGRKQATSISAKDAISHYKGAQI